MTASPTISSRISRVRAHPVVARAAPFLLFIALLMAGSTWSGMSWLVVARAAIIALLLAWFWPYYSELRNPAPARPAHWALAVIAGLAVFLVWTYLDHDWAVLSRSPGFAARLPDGGTDWVLGLARLAGIALVVPVMEELFWRSLVLRWIERHDFLAVDPGRVGMRAFFITTVLFALEHNQWFAGALAGMVYSALYMRTGNLWVPIVAHAVTNGALGVWVLLTHNWQFW